MSEPATPIRANTGFHLFSRVKSNPTHKDVLKHQRTPSRPYATRFNSFGPNDQIEPNTSFLSLPAKEGTGLRARRLSIGTQEVLVVETCELDDEFSSASKFGFSKSCGKGASATVKIMVRRGDKKGDGQRYAVKEFRKRNSRESEEEYVRKVKSEYAIAKSLQHPNIVETVRLCTHGGRWNHVMEFCAQGELFSLVDRRYMKQEDRNCIFKQVLRGVSYLHDHGIAHRDIKLENLLMTDAGYVKITDFGVSEVFSGDHPGVSSSHGLCGQHMGPVRFSTPGICGSKPYIAPEVLTQDKAYDPAKLDVWSCGILYMTLLLNGNPWQSANSNEINWKEFSDGWKAFHARFGDDVAINENCYPQCGQAFATLTSHGQRRCILKMMHPDPARRCTVKDVLADRWTKSINCCSPDDQGLPNGAIDVAKVSLPDQLSKMKIQAKHDHLPPPVKRLPQHRFDMGDGTSRYD